jgi:MFS family permease
MWRLGGLESSASGAIGSFLLLERTRLFVDESKRNFAAVCVALTFCFVVYSMLQVTIPVHALALGASHLGLGVVLSCQYLLPFLLAIPLGGVVTRHGGRRTLVGGALVMGVGLVLMQLLPGFYGLVLGQLLVGLAQLQMALSAQTVISSLATGTRLEGYFGWYSTWVSGGQVVGPLLAGGWIEWAGGVGYLFLLMAAIALTGALFGLFLTGEADRGQRVARSQIGFRAQARLMRANSGVQISIWITIAGMFVLGVYGNYLPVYLDSLEMSAAMIGLLVSLRAAVSMLARPFIPKFIALVGGRENATYLSLAVLSLGLGGLGLAKQAPAIGLLSVLVGLGTGLCQPLSMVVLAESVDKVQRAGALGMRLMANRAIQFLAPLSFGVVLELGGFLVSFALSAAVVMLIAAVLHRFGFGAAARSGDHRTGQ